MRLFGHLVDCERYIISAKNTCVTRDSKDTRGDPNAEKMIKKDAGNDKLQPRVYATFNMEVSRWPNLPFFEVN